MKLINSDSIKDLIEEGQAFEQQEDWESAFSSYEKAANLGSGDAAFAIAAMYLDKPFRQVEDYSAVMKKLQAAHLLCLGIQQQRKYLISSRQYTGWNLVQSMEMPIHA